MEDSGPDARLPPERTCRRSLRWLSSHRNLDDRAQIQHWLGGDSERLVVPVRGACGADDAAVCSHIATARSVLILVVET